MGFLDTAGGDFLPYIQWSSTAVQWSKKGENGKEPFTFTSAVFDMEHLKIGYIAIQPGSVDKVVVGYKDTPPAQPAGTKRNQDNTKDVPLYDKGFSVNVLLGKEFGEDRLYEFSTSQKGSLQAVSSLLTEYEAGKAANPGKVPVVTFSGHTNVKMGKGSSNVPNLAITSWIPRPTELDEGFSEAPVPAPLPKAVAGEF